MYSMSCYSTNLASRFRHLDGLPPWASSTDKVNALQEIRSASGEELSALMPSVLDRAFKGEL